MGCGRPPRDGRQDRGRRRNSLSNYVLVSSRRLDPGYSGVFLDPDGHPWEVAHNPFWTLHDDGSVSLSG